MASFFGFPNPVNETSARIVAAGAVVMGALFVATGNGWILVPLTYGFIARVLSGPKFSPLGRIATQVITPRIKVQHRFVAGPPKRFAQGSWRNVLNRRICIDVVRRRYCCASCNCRPCWRRIFRVGICSVLGLHHVWLVDARGSYP